MKKFKIGCKESLILVEKKDLNNDCLACKLKGIRADYFVVPMSVKSDDAAMD